MEDGEVLDYWRAIEGSRSENGVEVTAKGCDDCKTQFSAVEEYWEARCRGEWAEKERMWLEKEKRWQGRERELLAREKSRDVFSIGDSGGCQRVLAELDRTSHLLEETASTLETERALRKDLDTLISTLSAQRHDLSLELDRTRKELLSVSTHLEQKTQEATFLSKRIEEESFRAAASERKVAVLDESMVPAMWDLVFKLDEIAKKRGEEAVALKKRCVFFALLYLNQELTASFVVKSPNRPQCRRLLYISPYTSSAHHGIYGQIIPIVHHHILAVPTPYKSTAYLYTPSNRMLSASVRSVADIFFLVGWCERGRTPKRVCRSTVGRLATTVPPTRVNFRSRRGRVVSTKTTRAHDFLCLFIPPA